MNNNNRNTFINLFTFFSSFTFSALFDKFERLEYGGIALYGGCYYCNRNIIGCWSLECVLAACCELVSVVACIYRQFLSVPCAHTAEYSMSTYKMVNWAHILSDLLSLWCMQTLPSGMDIRNIRFFPCNRPYINMQCACSRARACCTKIDVSDRQTNRRLVVSIGFNEPVLFRTEIDLFYSIAFARCRLFSSALQRTVADDDVVHPHPIQFVSIRLF